MPNGRGQIFEGKSRLCRIDRSISPAIAGLVPGFLLQKILKRSLKA